jgi:WD40-like Beta Propeller Repeat
MKTPARTILTALCAVSASLTLTASVTQAAVTHNPLFQFSEVPASSGAPLPGRVTGLNSMTVDSGHVWIAEKIEDEQNPFKRVDKFNAATGGFISQFAHAERFPEYLGVAVGHLAGAPEPQVYLAEFPPAVGVYSESGTKLPGSGWTGAQTPATSWGQISSVAVDNSPSPGDSAAGDVYVADQAQKVVDVFKPDAEGNEHYVGQLPGVFESPGRVVVNSVNGDVLVLDGSAVDVFEPVLGTYTLSLKLTATPSGPFREVAGVAVDSGGDIYVANNPVDPVEGSKRLGEVAQFSAAGVYLGHIARTASDGFSTVRSVAVDPATQDVYVGAKSETTNLAAVYVFGPNVVLPDVTTKEAVSVKAGSATLEGTVNLDGEGPATCQFLYGTTKAFGQSAPCTEPVTNESGPVEVHKDLAGLEPDTTYFYRLQATNKNGTNVGEPAQDREFTTFGPGFHGQSVSDVASTSATFNATISPHSHATSVYFDYGTTTGYGSQAPAAPGVAIGAGPGDVTLAPQHVDGLSPGTPYHYRVVVLADVEVSAGVHEVLTFDGPDQTFTTQGGAGGPVLPDGRQWEMVTPPDKHAAAIGTIAIDRVTQAAAGGEAFTFVTNNPTETEPAGYAGVVQVLAQRTPGGWRSKDISSPHDAPTGSEIGGEEYKYFSEDLSLSVLLPAGAFTALSPEASEQTSYLHTSFQGAGFCGEACFRPLVTGKPGYANVPLGTVFGAGRPPALVGATPDLSHVVLESNVALTPGAVGGEGLYEWSQGHLALVSVLPNGEQLNGNVEVVAGARGGARHAVSNDGSRIVFAELLPTPHLYLRVNATAPQSPIGLHGECTVAADACTVQLDAVQGGKGNGDQIPQFQMASADGSRVFFTDQQRLTRSAGETAPRPKEGDLYECLIVLEAGTPACHLTDLTPEAASGAPARVLDIPPGASEDGSTVYFVADGVLAPGAVEGTCASNCEGGAEANLYMWHEGTVSLVARLSADDVPDWNGTGGTTELGNVMSRVSPDGRWLAFMSDRNLTGYDPRAASGAPVEEVYLYDRETGRLACASCDPTGARPVGRKESELLPGLDGSTSSWAETLLAGSVPSWTTYASSGTTLYQSRYLSDSGRLFFNSVGPLVPSDGNGVGDVYQFEPAGVGGCSSSTAGGSVVFVAASNGCVGLISSGRSPEESAFLDASASGADVFFTTAARLAPTDFDTSADVYDAHECSAAAPCLPPPAGVLPPCESADSCKAAPSAQPEIFGAPPSATFSGPGNPPPPPGAKPKTPAQIRAEKLAKALKACRVKRNKHNRTLCEKAAHKRYVVNTNAKGKKHAGGKRHG